MSYSCKIENEADFAKARVEDVNASYKDLAEVCGNIRRKPADAAVALLEDASEGKVPLRYRSHNTRMAHRKELMGQKGRWPMKAAGIVLKCLESAIANAKEKGLSEELIVIHACANKKNTYMRYSSKGRRNTSKMQTSRVEVVLREKEEGKKKRMEEAKKKKATEAKKPAKDDKLKMKSREELIQGTTAVETDLSKGASISDSGDKAVVTVTEKKTTITKAAATPKKEEAPKPEAAKPPAKEEKKEAPKTENPKPKTKGKDEEVA
jgi:large subunit ribosomal protein L22